MLFLIYDNISLVNNFRVLHTVSVTLEQRIVQNLAGGIYVMDFNAFEKV